MRRAIDLLVLVLLVLLVLLVVLGGCLPSRTAVFHPVDREIERRLGLDARWGDERVPAAIDQLLKTPLDREAAVRIAIAKNRRLQVQYDQLGIAASEVAAATVLAPLEVELQYKVALDGDGNELEVEAIQDILDLLQLPQRRGAARADLEAARARAVAATVELVANVERSYVDIVAMQQELELRQTAFDAASGSAEIVERMHAAGNVPDLALARERDRREQTRIDVARAQLDVEQARETMNEVLGLSGKDTMWSVTNRLPEIPAVAPALDAIERDAVAASLNPVGAVRVIEFVADNPGDWAFHCHMTHHVMNQMGHDVPNLIGADTKGLDARINRVVPGYMTMGATGMGEMHRMELPDNSISMVGGEGPFGMIDMGGMFTILKVRKQPTGFMDPGWYEHPAGSVAGEASAADLARDGIKT